MRTSSFVFPRKLIFGNHCLDDFIRELTSLNYKRVLIIADPNLLEPLDQLKYGIEEGGISVFCNTGISGEPGLTDFYRTIEDAEQNYVDAVIGMGGGSVLDVAKLVSAMCYTKSRVEQLFEGESISRRPLFLACLPTTSGTGSEVSPNAILFDERTQLKRAIVSPFLVPDMTFIDPVLTYTVPQAVTASTGIDALTHCIEAYTNKYSTAITDLYALEGIRLISRSLVMAFKDATNKNARWEMSLGSMYGGLCLGPVNTAAVHALAYPLGSLYQVPHGISNAVLLPHVMMFNLTHGVEKYANIARTMGMQENGDEMKMARSGIARIAEICRILKIPEKLSVFNIPMDAIDSLVGSAMGVQRLLKNNPRPMSKQDIKKLYLSLF